MYGTALSAAEFASRPLAEVVEAPAHRLPRCVIVGQSGLSALSPQAKIEVRGRQRSGSRLRISVICTRPDAVAIISRSLRA